MDNELQKTNPHTSERMYWIDQLRAMAFLCVLIGHVSTYKILGWVISSFHMPLFFMITGYTFSIDKMYETSLKDMVRKRAKSMLVPYLWLAFITLPIWVFNWKVLVNLDVELLDLIKGIFVWNNKIYETPCNPMWFVGALFIAYIYFWIAVKISKKDNVKFVAINVVYFILGYCTRNLHLPWHVNTALIGVTFISIGYFLRKFVELHFSKEKISQNKIAYVFIIAFIFVVGIYAAIKNGAIVMVYGNYNNILLFYISSIFISLFLTVIFYHLPYMKFISYVGQNTLLYLALHMGIIRFVENMWPQTKLDYNFGLFFAVLCFFILAAISWGINKFFPYVHGKKISKKTKVTQFCKFLCILWCSVVPAYLVMKGIFPTISLGDNMIAFGCIILCMAIVGYFILNRYLKIFFLEE